MTSAASLISKLEKELRDLWIDDPAAPPKSRVCTMNLEVVASSKELLERYAVVVDEVTASIPSRAILASLEPDEPEDELTGTATAVCSLEAGRNICSERITFAAKGNACARSASAIEAFLLPELPTALVWLGRVHVDDPVFEDLSNDANRIVLDSEYTSLSSLIHVCSWARKQTNKPHVADLAWTRIASWQELVARLFDGDDFVPFASHITRVRVDQASPAGAQLGPEPALFLGWLATRLGWKTARLGGALRFKRTDGGTVSLELGSLPRTDGVAPNALSALSIEAHHGEATLKGTIRREEGDPDVILWKQESPAGAFEQRVRFGQNKAAKWLERTLHRPAEDPTFDESVAFAEQIVEDGLKVS